MITAHDLFTYGNVDNNFPNGDLFRSHKGLWKCQERNEQQLYDMGVRMFDCRVYWDEKYWRAAHGAVNFKITFNTLEELCSHFDSLGKGEALYRIVLEKDDHNGETKFREQASGLCAKHQNIWTILIKYKTSNWLNDTGMVENNIASLVSRGYTFANHVPWESPNKEYNVAPPSFDLSNISKYANFKIEEHARNGFTDDRGYHDPNPNPTTWDMLNSKEFLYSMDYCHIYIGNDRCMPNGELSAKYGLESSTDEANKVLPKSDLVAKGYTINGNYANNQLVIGKDISKK